MVRITRPWAIAAVVAAASRLVTGQTFSECDPIKTTGCPARPGLAQADYSIDFVATQGQGASSVWKNLAKPVTFGPNGAQFTLAAYGDSVTYVSNFYIFFGYVEVKLRAAPGQGIVSSFVLQSDDLDELDWEMIGSQTTQVQSNYFGKGNTTLYNRGGFHNVQTPALISHTYALNWTEQSTTWLIDGVPVRTLLYADALGGANYPQTPMNIRLGDWIAGTPGNAVGTINWAGGIADMSNGPYVMYVESVTVRNYNPAVAYAYGDQSGSYQSIKFSNTPVVMSNSSSLGSSSAAAVVQPSASAANSAVVKAGSSSAASQMASASSAMSVSAASASAAGASAASGSAARASVASGSAAGASVAGASAASASAMQASAVSASAAAAGASGSAATTSTTLQQKVASTTTTPASAGSTTASGSTPNGPPPVQPNNEGDDEGDDCGDEPPPPPAGGALPQVSGEPALAPYGTLTVTQPAAPVVVTSIPSISTPALNVATGSAPAAAASTSAAATTASGSVAAASYPLSSSGSVYTPAQASGYTPAQVSANDASAVSGSRVLASMVVGLLVAMAI